MKGKHPPDSLPYLIIVGDKIPSYKQRICRREASSRSLRDLTIVGDKTPSYIGNVTHLAGALRPACLATRGQVQSASERLHVWE